MDYKHSSRVMDEIVAFILSIPQVIDVQIKKWKNG
jgi:hypothetical protein